jgi:hypothetical protein
MWHRDVPFTDLKADSMTYPQLDGDPGAIIAFPGKIPRLMFGKSLN